MASKKDGFYLFYDKKINNVPDIVRTKYSEIYNEYYKNPGDVEPTQKSLMKAFKLLFADTNAKLTKKEQNALKALRRSSWYPNLRRDAIKEFERAKDYRLHGLWANMVFLDHVMRHPKKMETIDKISKLRCKVRKIHGLDRNARVGF